MTASDGEERVGKSRNRAGQMSFKGGEDAEESRIV